MSDWVETPVRPEVRAELPNCRADRRGKLTVMVDSPFDGNDGRFHLSIAHPSRLPTWAEVKDARVRFLPAELHFCVPFPPRRYWLNAHEFCLHLWETRDAWLTEQWEFEGNAYRRLIGGKP